QRNFSAIPSIMCDSCASATGVAPRNSRRSARAESGSRMTLAKRPGLIVCKMLTLGKKYGSSHNLRLTILKATCLKGHVRNANTRSDPALAGADGAGRVFHWAAHSLRLAADAVLELQSGLAGSLHREGLRAACPDDRLGVQQGRRLPLVGDRCPRPLRPFHRSEGFRAGLWPHRVLRPDPVQDDFEFRALRPRLPRR